MHRKSDKICSSEDFKCSMNSFSWPSIIIMVPNQTFQTRASILRLSSKITIHRMTWSKLKFDINPQAECLPEQSPDTNKQDHYDIQRRSLISFLENYTPISSYWTPETVVWSLNELLSYLLVPAQRRGVCCRSLCVSDMQQNSWTFVQKHFKDAILQN